MLMQPERLTHDAPDPITFDRAPRHFGRYRETEPRTACIIAARGHSEKTVPEAPSPCVQRLEVRLAAQPPFRWKSESLAILVGRKSSA